MSKDFYPQRLDVALFATEAATLVDSSAGDAALLQYPRIAQETPELTPAEVTQLQINWQAAGEAVTATGGKPEHWLHLRVQSQLQLACQRCLRPVLWPLDLERSYRFVADEATAERDDAELEEDLLVISRQFNAVELVEDELLMELPLIAAHEQCPVALPTSAQTPDFESSGGEDAQAPGKPNPFAALANMKIGPG